MTETSRRHSMTGPCKTSLQWLFCLLGAIFGSVKGCSKLMHQLTVSNLYTSRETWMTSLWHNWVSSSVVQIVTLSKEYSGLSVIKMFRQSTSVQVELFHQPWGMPEQEPIRQSQIYPHPSWILTWNKVTFRLERSDPWNSIHYKLVMLGLCSSWSVSVNKYAA